MVPLGDKDGLIVGFALLVIAQKLREHHGLGGGGDTVCSPHPCKLIVNSVRARGGGGVEAFPQKYRAVSGQPLTKTSGEETTKCDMAFTV